MKRGELYRVFRGKTSDPRRSRVYVVVSRQALIDSKFSTVICAPVYSQRLGLSTQVNVGIEEGLKMESSINCDALMSLDKNQLTNFMGSLPANALPILDNALKAALALE